MVSAWSRMTRSCASLAACNCRHRLGLGSGGRSIVARGVEQSLHVARLDASISTQSVGCALKIESEDSKGDCRERPNRPIIMLSKFGGTDTD